MHSAYTYDILTKDIGRLKNKYSDIITFHSIGTSLCGRKLHRLTIGTGSTHVFYNGAHHGMEWLTAALLIRFAEECADTLQQGKKFREVNLYELFDDVTLEIVPMVNPDGVELAAHGLSEKNPNYHNLLAMSGGDFSAWQANNRGVDLNHNYNAGWKQSKAAEEENGIQGAGATRYSGIAPESEPESRAVANFTRQQQFDLVIAFHSQGQVIYWDFNGEIPLRGREIAEYFTTVSPYALDQTEGIASFGGYKDWFIQTFHKPGYTVEIGLGKNPLPMEQLPQIYENTIGILLGGLTEAMK